MALPYATLDAITDAGYLPGIKNQWFDETALLSALHASGPKLQSGERIKRPLAYQYSKGGWYNEYGQFDISGEDFLSASYVDWKLLEVPMVMSRLEQLKNSEPAAVHSLMEAIADGAKMQIANLMETALLSANTDSATAINGLDHAIDSGTVLSASATYANIAKGTYTWWAGNLVDINDDIAANGGPVYKNVNRIIAKAHKGNQMPDMVFMGVESFHTYIGESAAGLPANASNVQRLVNTTDAARGFLSASANGINVFADSNITEVAGGTTSDNNRIYALNSKHIDLVSHADENIRREPWGKPLDQNVIVSHLFWAGGLSLDPRYHCIGYGFDVNAVA